MRHYDRADFRHLNDGDRYRDYDYLADDGWFGEGERASERPAAAAGEASRAGEGEPRSPERRWGRAARHARRYGDQLVALVLGARELVARVVRVVRGL